MKRDAYQTMTATLRKAIADSGLPMLTIAKESGVERTSLIRFARGDLSLRLDNADRLAAYLGLRLVRDPNTKPPEQTPENLARPKLAKQQPKRKANGQTRKAQT